MALKDEGSLPEILTLVGRTIQRSFYEDPSIILRPAEWTSAIKFVTTKKISPEAIAAAITKGSYESLNLSQTSGADFLIAARNRLACVFNKERTDNEWYFGQRQFKNRRSMLRFFWKVLLFWEFAALKTRAYDDYADFLTNETARLKEVRHSPKQRLIQEDLLRLAVSDPAILRFLNAFDKHIRGAAPFHRRIYSAISHGCDLDRHRTRVNKLLEEWEREVDKWEPTIMDLWQKVARPFRAFLWRPPVQ